MHKKILIVEDEFIVANNLQQVLKIAGYDVTGIAASAEEAEEFMKTEKPDIVLLDIRLQGKRSGIDIANKLRAQHIAFVYLSANSNQQVLEEAKATEPYGFLVKPFRKKDLLVMLDIAWYRHMHSLESANRRERVLEQQITAINKEITDPKDHLLQLARLLQSHIPFDLITLGPRPLDPVQYKDNAFFRIGFDEYQFIGEKELLTISNLKRAALPVILANTHINRSVSIYNNDGNGERPNVPSIQKTLMETFNAQSYLVLPLELADGVYAHYFFYSLQQHVYTNTHISSLDRLKDALIAAATKIVSGESFESKQLEQASDAPSLSSKEMLRPEFRDIIGCNHLLLAALDLAAQVAPYNTSVLILGETGTGKEKLAQSIHLLSPRKNGPFIKVNCAAIPPTLIESELFGHEKGAFTGAIEKRKGRFEQADGGTIFLDEIGELPLDMQVKILRVLQEKEIEYVGGGASVKVNVRILAATNRNLEKEVADKNFRLDLYYRLNVFPIVLPSLRERQTDIEELAIFFAEKFCREFNKPFPGITASMMNEMKTYQWPGNIRELENVLEQSVILHNGAGQLQLKRILAGPSTAFTLKTDIRTLDDVKRIQQETERSYIVSVLKQTKGKIRGTNGAAELMNLRPTTLESRITKLNIKREEFSDRH